MDVSGPPLVVREIAKTFSGVHPGDPPIRVVDNVSFSVAAGQFVSLLGPSGCGKTTLLRIIAGLTQADHGQITFGEQSLERPGRERGFVFQNFGLLPWRTVQDNVEFALEIHGVERVERHAMAARQITLVGLAGFERHFPHQISGGMQQRVGLARAFAIDPPILLMDEPFSAVDAQTRETLQDELLRILEKRSARVLFVTHSIEEALYLSDRVLIFSRRPAQIIEDLTVPLPKPRWSYDVQADPTYLDLRRHIRHRMGLANA